MQEPNTPEAPAQAGCALRLFWMLAGNAVVFSSLAYIVIDEHAFPGILDGVVWVAVALMIGARRLDITRYQGTTADGEPATLRHWRIWALTLLVVTGVASGLAHAIAS